MSSPKVLGDFGILIDAGWSKVSASILDLASALTFLLGGWLAYALAGRFEVTWLLPFAAGKLRLHRGRGSTTHPERPEDGVGPRR